MNNRPNIDSPFGDNPVLDILHIAYVDFSLGRLTPIEKIQKIMFKTYPSYSKGYIKKLIKIITDSLWFNRSISTYNFVHLKERGVEIYLNMLQHYLSEKRAHESKVIMQWTLAIAIATSIIGLISIYIMI